MRKLTKALTVAAACAAALSVAGCAGTTPGSGNSATGGDTGPVTLAVWQNGTDTKSANFWKEVATDFNAKYSNVTVNIVTVQNEDLDGKLQTAMQAGTPPDVFLQRGGGKLQDMINAGMVLDITSAVSSDVKTNMSAALNLNTIGGKMYAMPMSFQPEGLWYNTALFTAAGITGTPTDMTSFNDAISKLKTSGVAPIALGGKDAWPAAHWFYSFSLRECSKDVVNSLTATTQTMSDPCWLKALQDVKSLADSGAFNQGFLTTVAQQGATSSAGLLANGQAGMELMGAWEPGVVGGLTPDKQPLPTLDFFAFPAVAGGAGDPTAMMAGSDGYSCSTKAPEPACTNFLNFLGQQKYVQDYATAYTTMPARADAAASVTDQSLKSAMAAFAKASYTVLWFDTSLGQDTGNAVNQAVVNLLSGSVDPQGALTAMQTALKNR